MESMEDIIRRIVREELDRAFDTSAVRVERQVIATNPLAHYSVAKVAELLDVSTDYVYDRIADKSLEKVVELGGGQAKQRISAVELQRYIDQRTYGGT